MTWTDRRLEGLSFLDDVPAFFFSFFLLVRGNCFGKFPTNLLLSKIANRPSYKSTVMNGYINGINYKTCGGLNLFNLLLLH